MLNGGVDSSVRLVEIKHTALAHQGESDHVRTKPATATTLLLNIGVAQVLCPRPDNIVP